MRLPGFATDIGAVTTMVDGDTASSSRGLVLATPAAWRYRAFIALPVESAHRMSDAAAAGSGAFHWGRESPRQTTLDVSRAVLRSAAQHDGPRLLYLD